MSILLNNARHKLKGVSVSLKPKLIDSSPCDVRNGKRLTIKLRHGLGHPIRLKENRKGCSCPRRDGLPKVHEYRSPVVGVHKGVVSESEHHVCSVHRHTLGSDCGRTSSVHPCERIIPHYHSSLLSSLIPKSQRLPPLRNSHIEPPHN